MNVLANNNELLKYIDIWNKTESSFNKKGFIIDLCIMNT